MRWPEFFVCVAVSTLTGAIFWWLPRMRRGGLYFGVTVAPEFRESARGRTIAFHYRLAIYAATVLTWIAGYLGAQQPPGAAAGLAPLLQTAIALAAWVFSWSCTRPHAAPPDSRRAALVDQEEPAGLWLVATAAPLIAMAACALYLLSVYDALPDRYPVHWNAAGIADRFAAKSWRSVFFGCVMGSSIILMMAANAWVLLRFSRRGPGGPGGFTHRYLHANLRMFAILSWGLGLLFTAVTLAPVFPADAHGAIFIGVLLLPLALVAITLLPLMKLSEEAGGESDQTADEHWRLGMFYFNPADPVLVVPKRDGLGYSLNFAQPKALLFFAGAMTFVLAPLLLLTGM